MSIRSRWQDERSYARLDPAATRRLRDDAAARGLGASREHYDYILTRSWIARARAASSATRQKLGNARVRVSNAWYRAAGRRIHGAHQGYRNWLSGRARARGRDPVPDRLTRGIGSRLPGYRNRINRATGRPRWTDRSDGALTRWRADRERTQGHRDAAARQRLYGDPAGTWEQRVRAVRGRVR